MQAAKTSHVRSVAAPLIMYGTAWKEDHTQALVLEAIAAGFRAFDTANQRKHYVEEGTGLVDIEMGRPVGDTHAQHAATFGVWLGGGELKFRAVELVWDVSREPPAPAHPIGARREGEAGLQEITAAPRRKNDTFVRHYVPHLWLFLCSSTPCSDGLLHPKDITEPPGVTVE